MWFVKHEMADCLAQWNTSYAADDFYRLSNQCSDDSNFADDDGKEVTSLLDDLAEAKRHCSSSDDIDNDPDADYVSLWDDGVYEHWTTKDLGGGPTLAELNGGELTDMEQFEPLPFARKRRKSSRSSSTSVSRPSTERLMALVKICDVNNPDSALETVQQTGDDTARHVSAKEELPCDQRRTVSLAQVQDLKGTLCVSKPDHKTASATSKHCQTEDSLGACSSSSNHAFNLEHSEELNVPPSTSDVFARKKLKTNCGAVVTVHHSSVADVDETEVETSDVENYADSMLASDGKSSSWSRSRASSSSSSSSCTDTQKQYFWLYNVQSKGPKCQPATDRMLPTSADPHVLSHFCDPVVADPRSRTSPTRHSRRQRDRSALDADADANPRRLQQIGDELQRLTAIINSPASGTTGNLPVNGAADCAALSPREKNKYASRICRLKRKAQHEANKIKLHGLEEEHRQLMAVLGEIKMQLVQRVRGRRSGQRSPGERGSSLSSALQSLMKSHLSDMIAEHTDEYVSCTLERLRRKTRR